MARQEGIILLTGPVDNLSYYKTKGGYFVRRKSGVSAERINSEPAFERTRKNIAEFRRATLATKLFRSAFQLLFQNAADNRVSSRLTGLMVKVIQGDVKHPHGLRTVTDGKLSLPERFEMNKHGKLSSTLQVPFTSAIDRVTGSMVIDIPSFVPAEMICAPKGATHYRLTAGAAAIDFEANTYSTAMSVSADLPMAEMVQGPIQLTAALPPSPTHPLFVVLAIEFLQEVNGIQYALGNGRNAMAIVSLERPKQKQMPRRIRRVSTTINLRPPVRKRHSRPDEDKIEFQGKSLHRRLRSKIEAVKSVDSS